METLIRGSFYTLLWNKSDKVNKINKNIKDKKSNNINYMDTYETLHLDKGNTAPSQAPMGHSQKVNINQVINKTSVISIKYKHKQYLIKMK